MYVCVPARGKAATLIAKTRERTDRPTNIRVTLLLILLHAAPALIIAVVKREQRAVTKWIACVQRVLTEKTIARAEKKNFPARGRNKN